MALVESLGRQERGFSADSLAMVSINFIGGSHFPILHTSVQEHANKWLVTARVPIVFWRSYIIANLTGFFSTDCQVQMLRRHLKQASDPQPQWLLGIPPAQCAKGDRDAKRMVQWV